MHSVVTERSLVLFVYMIFVLEVTKQSNASHRVTSMLGISVLVLFNVSLVLQYDVEVQFKVAVQMRPRRLILWKHSAT